MLNRIRSIFGLSSTPPEDVSWLRQLGDTDIFVIAAMDTDGIDASTLTKEQLLAQIRGALERNRQARREGYALFVYSATQDRRLPFFTSNDHAQRFYGEFSKARNRVFPFMVLQTKGSFLGKIVPGSCDVVVMNDHNPDERPLTPHEMAAARQMWG
jgi:hypothetical protein